MLRRLSSCRVQSDAPCIPLPSSAVEPCRSLDNLRSGFPCGYSRCEYSAKVKLLCLCYCSVFSNVLPDELAFLIEPALVVPILVEHLRGAELRSLWIYENGEDKVISARTRSWEAIKKFAQAQRVLLITLKWGGHWSHTTCRSLLTRPLQPIRRRRHCRRDRSRRHGGKQICPA